MRFKLFTYRRRLSEPSDIIRLHNIHIAYDTVSKYRFFIYDIIYIFGENFVDSNISSEPRNIIWYFQCLSWEIDDILEKDASKCASFENWTFMHSLPLSIDIFILALTAGYHCKILTVDGKNWRDFTVGSRVVRKVNFNALLIRMETYSTLLVLEMSRFSMPLCKIINKFFECTQVYSKQYA